VGIEIPFVVEKK
jgi:hypothetical protein